MLLRLIVMRNLDEIVRDVDERDKLILAGNFNARVDKDSGTGAVRGLDGWGGGANSKSTV